MKLFQMYLKGGPTPPLDPARVGNRPYLRIHFRPSQPRQRRQPLHQGQAKAIAQAATEKHQQVYPKGRKTGASPRTNSGRDGSQEGKAAGARPPKKPVRGTQGVQPAPCPGTEAEGQGERKVQELQRARDPQPNALHHVRRGSPAVPQAQRRQEKGSSKRGNNRGSRSNIAKRRPSRVNRHIRRVVDSPNTAHWGTSNDSLLHRGANP